LKSSYSFILFHRKVCLNIFQINLRQIAPISGKLVPLHIYKKPCSLLPHFNKVYLWATLNNHTVTKWHLHSFPYYFSLLVFSSLHLLEPKHGWSPKYPSLLSSQKHFLTPFSYTKMTLHALRKTSTPTTPSFLHQNPSLHLVAPVV